MTTPNNALRAARNARRMSQDDLARALREVGCDTATKRLVQRWEAGTTLNPRATHIRALEQVMRMPIESLGFGAVEPGRSLSGDDANGHAVESAIGRVPHETTAATPRPVVGSLNGVWLSRYEYYSSGRDATFTAVHHVVVLQRADALTVRSLPGSAGSIMEMNLTMDGNIATGTWAERTDPDGYYRGATYHGAVQMLVEPTVTRMAGKWIGFGKSFDINSGPWELVLRDRSTSKATIDAFDRPPEP